MYDPKLSRSRVFLPAILSGLLLYASFFPLNLGFLAWIALVPLLSLVRANARSRRIYFAAFVGGLVIYLPAIRWMSVAHEAMFAAWIFLAFCCAIFLAMTLAIIRKLDRVGLPLWLSAPIGFVAMEYFRSHFPTGYTWMELFNARHPIGFGWYMVGHTQHDYSVFIQIADLAGVYAVTFLVVLVNAAVWYVVGRNAQVRVWLLHIREPAWNPRRSSLVAAGALFVTIVYGLVRTSHEPFAEGPRVALIQENMTQDLKDPKLDQMAKDFRRFSDEALAVAEERRPDLVIWPETSYPYGWSEVSSDARVADVSTDVARRLKMSRDDLAIIAEHWPVATLYGASTTQLESDGTRWLYNSALLADAKGQPVARYDKIHLVPLGEYVPFPETFPFLKHFAPRPPGQNYNCRPGEKWTRFPLSIRGKEYHFACLICYEDTDASLARHYVRPSEPGVDFFVNISNDGWFRGTEEHQQHLAICRFRAVETRRSVVRSVNMGISAIIDPDGNIVALPGATWRESKSVEGIVRGNVPIDTRTTLYARFGDWLPVAAWLVFLGGIVVGFIRRKRSA
jgi:apolipoprotein N-acyltransferase